MRGPQKWTEEAIAARFKAGKGRGVQDDYRPWLTVRDFSSSGTQTRIPSLVVNRTVHTFSYIERAMYLAHEFEPGLVDYREQYPMDRRVTMGAAQALGIKHPVYPRDRTPVVMTIDALVTRRLPDGTHEVSAWDAKPIAELEKKRVREKLSLHRAFCMHFGIKHVLFTEESVPKTVTRNLTWLRAALPKALESRESAETLKLHLQLMLADLKLRTPHSSVLDYCLAHDRTHGAMTGTALRAFKCLVWHRVLHLDLNLEEVLAQRMPNLDTTKSSELLKVRP